ncbi:MAG: helix-turn-helix domain-containing protein [Oscillospiraceae bacterium]
MIRNFPDLMKSKRLDLNMSMGELSQRLGISKRRLYRYENGEAEPSTLTFLRICSVLKINPNIFLK